METDTVDDLEKKIEEVDKELTRVDAQIAKWKKIQRGLHERKTSLKNSIDKIKSDAVASVDWSGSTYEWSDDVNSTLKNVFQINSFRPKQLSVINSTLSGQHAIVVMPTGAGKSLCYQLPALVRLGLTVVVSPLVSLMEDQVRSLTKKDIPAKLITSTLSREASTEALNVLKDKNTTTKLLYVTPERFAKSKRFMANLQKCFTEGRLQRIAIDEVHCCSQWGHDFRPDYKYLGILANMFPGIPILGLTATATASVLTDVQKILNITGCLVIKSTFNRPNLFYKILPKPQSQDECLTILEKFLRYRYKGESGIIYTNTVKDCDALAEGLRKRGLKVGCYHAYLEADKRSKVHTKWHDKEYQAIVATIAFGMGIDKPDVRFVIHHTISKSMENYYQESGRAGRDGLRAECVTLYRMQDIFKVSTMVFSSNTLDNLYGMVKYCISAVSCRRQIIAEHFDEDWGNTDCNEMCDFCCSQQVTKDISIEAHCRTLASILDNAHNMDIKMTAQKLVDAWFLKGPGNLRHKGKEPSITRVLGEDIIAYLIVEGFLLEDFHFTAYSTISYLKKGPNCDLVQDPNFSLKMPVGNLKGVNFDLESPAPTSVNGSSEVEVSEWKEHGKDTSKNSKKRNYDNDDVKAKKKTKAIIIDDDDYLESPAPTSMNESKDVKVAEGKSEVNRKDTSKNSKRKSDRDDVKAQKKSKAIIIDDDEEF